MEPPARFDSRSVHDEKVKVLRPIRRSQPNTRTMRRPRHIGPASSVQTRHRLPAGARRGNRSNTETFVAMRLTVDNWRWAGTPFYLRTGKRMPRRATEVAIQSNRTHSRIATLSRSTAPNRRVDVDQPDEGASLRFSARSRAHVDIRNVSMDFQYGSSFLKPSAEAYERLLLDALLGDSTLLPAGMRLSAVGKCRRAPAALGLPTDRRFQLRCRELGTDGSRCPDPPRRP